MKPSAEAQLVRLHQEKDALLGKLREVEERIEKTKRKKDNEGERTIRTRALQLANYGMVEEGEVMERVRAGITPERIAMECGVSVIRIRRIIAIQGKKR